MVYPIPQTSQSFVLMMKYRLVTQKYQAETFIWWLPLWKTYQRDIKSWIIYGNRQAEGKWYVLTGIFFLKKKLFTKSNSVLIFFFSETQNCGGNGNAFLYFPSETVNPCVKYSWDVTIILGKLPHRLCPTISSFQCLSLIFFNRRK